MNLRERLRLMKPAGTSPQAPPAHTSPQRSGPSDPKGVDIPGAFRIQTAAGPALCVEHISPLDTSWGDVPLSTALSVRPEGWVRLIKGVPPGAAPSLQDAAFLDTETTGLERGTGTYAFLVGVGRFVAEGLRVRQFIMCDYDEEEPVLQAMLQELEGAGALVTFNGKSFDWPLLQTRSVLNRLRLPDLPHLDLLHPARRLWGDVVPSCRLTQLEGDILKVAREGDVPSELIPWIYFNFVRTRDPEPLLPVLEHNRYDIVSTVALSGYLCAAVATPLHASPAGRPLSGAELYGVGRLLAALEETDAGIDCLDEALRRELPQALRAGCATLLATLLKRTRQYTRAVDVWETMVDQGLNSISACVELAKYHEHVSKELRSAREWTLKALEIQERRRLLRGLRKEPVPAEGGSETDALLHRLERIESKLRRKVAGNGDSLFPA